MKREAHDPRFANLGFEDFRRLANDPELSDYQKIGFPDAFRDGREGEIHADILAKMPPMRREGAVVIDIGPGCTQLPRLGIAHAERLRQELHLVDCEEMLALLPDSPGVKRTAARFPDCPALLDRLRGRTDAVLAYSILQCVFTDGDAWRFFDAALDLLAPGGHALFGDVANISMRKRLYASDAGKAFHRRFTGRDEDPDVGHGRIEHGAIDDGVLMGMVQRARAAGFHAFLLPQPATLPMHNRREDLLVVRP